MLKYEERIRRLNHHPLRGGARYVLYWARFNRRVTFHHGLLVAAELANQLDLPLLYYERLSASAPYANDRLHTFVLEGVPETARRLQQLGVGYVFDLVCDGSGPGDTLERLAAQAAALLTDDYPDAVAARHDARVPTHLSLPVWAVDSSCIVPMSLIGERQYAAYSIRPKLRRWLAKYLKPLPSVRVRRRYSAPPDPRHVPVSASKIPCLVRSCVADHMVRPSLTFRGGAAEAERRLRRFLTHNLRRYARFRNQPATRATSDLSPYLHFGQLSALEAAWEAKSHAEQEGLIAEEFLEELIVRRELAFNFCRFAARVDSLEELPAWARVTLERHAADRRPFVYRYEQFRDAETHDELWNATQKELLLTGKIHGYYRMYWGKKIIEWSASYQEALETMITLHERFALDGRDPNTYANILWCFGLHDRPWRERPVLGTLRYISREGMQRKTDVGAYLRQIAGLERTGRLPEPVE